MIPFAEFGDVAAPTRLTGNFANEPLIVEAITG